MATKKKRALNTQNDRWVAITADSFDTSKTDDSKPVFVRLKNPATDAAALYLFGMGDSHVYEVKAFDEDHHSWFIGQTVQRDGRLLYITPMDPLYLLLPYIVEAGKGGKFQPVEQVVMDEDFPACSRLLRCARTQASLPQIAEEKEFGSQRVYKYNQEKTMEWLKKKVNQTVKALKKSNISVGGGVKSATYIRAKQESNVQEEDYLRYAHGLISEYISEDLSKELQTVLRLPEIMSPTESEPPVKKRKVSDTPVEAGEDYTVFNSASFARKPPKKMTSAQKSLAKVDKTGMKTMSAFFSPKVKIEKN